MNFADRSLRVMLDSNVFDELAEDDELLALCLSHVHGGTLRLIVTHVQADELAAISIRPTDGRVAYRDYLMLSLERMTAPVITAGVVLDVSRFDQSALFSEQAAERHRQFVGGSAKRANDALILATAEREGVPLVTMESKPIKLNRMRRFFATVTLWSIGDFRTAVLGLPDPPTADEAFARQQAERPGAY